MLFLRRDSCFENLEVGADGLSRAAAKDISVAALNVPGAAMNLLTPKKGSRALTIKSSKLATVVESFVDRVDASYVR